MRNALRTRHVTAGELFQIKVGDVFSTDFSMELERLNLVLARLDDLAMDALREFIESKDPKDKESERRLHKARRAVAKAIAELEAADVE